MNYLWVFTAFFVWDDAPNKTVESGVFETHIACNEFRKTVKAIYGDISDLTLYLTPCKKLKLDQDCTVCLPPAVIENLDYGTAD